MSDAAADLVRQWELNDPRDRWRHTGGTPPTAHNKPLRDWQPPDEIERYIARMLVCGVCGADATAGFGVTAEDIRMGDVGTWRCSEHRPDRQASYTQEQWAAAQAAGQHYPDITPAHEAAE